MKKGSHDNRLSAIRLKMRKKKLPEKSIERFVRLIENLGDGTSGQIDRSMIEPVTDLADSDSLTGYAPKGLEVLNQTVVIKLNGGLGTSMGLDKAKAILPAKNNLSFLDIVIRQLIFIRETTSVKIPLVFMNSGVTHEDTMNQLKKYPEMATQIPFYFMQLLVPKLRQSDYFPVNYSSNPDLEWCPPGHGDIYFTLQLSGILNQLLDLGYRYAFVSNTDNLGATLDMEILGYFSGNDFPFLMEVADRTVMDRKGGHLCRLTNGHLALREVAQCPESELNEFQDIHQYKYFNTNTIWLNLNHLSKALIRTEGIIDLPLIVNKKPVNPQDVSSEPVVQLETAMGAAISVFDHATALRVPRRRFLPVKTCQDLLVIWSDRYLLNEDYSLAFNPDSIPDAEISMDPNYYKMLHDMQSRFPDGVPSLSKCRFWHVEGDFRFGKDVTISGSVRMLNRSKQQALIPSGSRLADSDFIIE